MATNTMIALDKITVSGTSTASVTFSSISQAYTDLVLVVSGSLYGGANRTSFVVQVGNGSIDTGTNYSSTWVAGNGTTAVSSRYSNGTNFLTGHISEAVGTTTVNFMNYSNTSTYKTFIARGNSMGQVGSFDVGGFGSLWRSYSAINTIKIYPNDGSFYNSGTTFSLYGIAAEGVNPAAKATGGAIYSDADYYYHVFGASGTFTPLQSLTADVLVVAGGGGAGGGTRNGGGAGAGGLLAFTSQSLSATGYTCTVGAGGAGGTDNKGTSSGGNSQFGALTTVVGGGLGAGYSGGSQGAASGGSGGGGGGGAGGGGATGTSGQGNAGGGGNYNYGFGFFSGGGGGAGAAGTSGTDLLPGPGGVGSSTYSSWGVATGVGENVSGTYYLAGGGGGGNQANGTVIGAAGGYGGGGRGNTLTGFTGVAGTANTGGGGGGGGWAGASGPGIGGNGGSGVVIVRYAK